MPRLGGAFFSATFVDARRKKRIHAHVHSQSKAGVDVLQDAL
jgi:hypothetical protein